MGARLRGMDGEPGGVSSSRQCHDSSFMFVSPETPPQTPTRSTGQPQGVDVSYTDRLWVDANTRGRCQHHKAESPNSTGRQRRHLMSYRPRHPAGNARAREDPATVEGMTDLWVDERPRPSVRPDTPPTPQQHHRCNNSHAEATGTTLPDSTRRIHREAGLGTERAPTRHDEGAARKTALRRRRHADRSARHAIALEQAGRCPPGHVDKARAVDRRDAATNPGTVSRMLVGAPSVLNGYHGPSSISGSILTAPHDRCVRTPP